MSYLPARVLLPGGERPAPTKAGVETGAVACVPPATSAPRHAPQAGLRAHLVAKSFRTLTKKERQADACLSFLAGAEGLVSAAASVGSRQSATGARSPLGTRFWSGCGNAPQGAGEGRCCPVSAASPRESGVILVLRAALAAVFQVFYTFSFL